MGTSSSKLKRWLSGSDNSVENGNSLCKRKYGTPFIYTRKGSMYFDEDGDLAHEFYEEIFSNKHGIKTYMRRIHKGLIPQGEVFLPIPCLHVDFPLVLYQDT